MGVIREPCGGVFCLYSPAALSGALSSSRSGIQQVLLFALLCLGTLVGSQECGDGPGGVSCVCNDQTFSCSNAGLTEIPADIPASVTLINVSSNAIVNLEQTALVKFQQNLEIVIFTNNQLQGINPAVFNNLPALKELYLDGNNLTTLEEITGVPNLQIIDISRNPINCDDRLKWLASINRVVGPSCVAEFLATLELTTKAPLPESNPKPIPEKETMNNTTHDGEGHHPSAARIYTVSIVLPILVVAFVCTIFVAIIVYRNKQKEAKYNSTVRYSAVQKDRGGGRVYDDVTTEL